MKLVLSKLAACVLSILTLGSVANATSQTLPSERATAVSCEQNEAKGSTASVQPVLAFGLMPSTGMYQMQMRYRTQHAGWASLGWHTMGQDFKLKNGKMVGTIGGSVVAIDMNKPAASPIALPNGEAYPAPGLQSWCRVTSRISL